MAAVFILIMHNMTTVVDRLDLVKRGRKLEYFTIGYNSLEGLIAVIAGLSAGSIALVGFGFDSAIEVTSGAALLFRLRPGLAPERCERVEILTLRVVGMCFLILAAYVAYEAIASLVLRKTPDHSFVGIVLAAVSLVIMPLLVRAKRQVARGIRSPALRADAKQTEFCTYLSAILLGGLLLNATLGWWWADPVAALAMVPFIANEGIEAVRGETCCD